MEKSRKDNNYPSKAKKYKRRLLFYLQTKKNFYFLNRRNRYSNSLIKMSPNDFKQTTIKYPDFKSRIFIKRRTPRNFLRFIKKLPFTTFKGNSQIIEDEQGTY